MSNTVTLEPFVYTSVASHYVNGYQCVLVGKELNRHKGTIETIYELSQVLCQQGYRDLPASMGIVVKDHFFFIELRPLAKDWMGRRGMYVTGLTCKLSEIYNNIPNRNVYSIPKPKSGLISHEDALKIIQKEENKFKKTIFMPGEEIAVENISLQPADKIWTQKHIKPLVAAVEMLANKQNLLPGPALGSDPLRFGRCLSALVPSGRRLLTYGENLIESDLEHLEKFSLTPHILFGLEDTAYCDDFHAVNLKSRPTSKTMRAVVDWFNDYIGRNEFDYEEEIDVVAGTLKLDKKSIEAFWNAILHERIVREVRAIDYAIGLDPVDCAHCWRELYDRYNADAQHLFQEETIYQLTKKHTDWFAKTMQALESGGNQGLIQLIDHCLTDVFLVKWQEGVEQIESIQNIFDSLGDAPAPHSCFWSVCESILIEHKFRPSDRDLAAICHKDTSDPIWDNILASTVEGDEDAAKFARQLISSPAFRNTAQYWSGRLNHNTKSQIINTALQSPDGNLRMWCYESASLKNEIAPDLVDTDKIAVRGKEVEGFIGAINPNASECFEWWRRWPSSDTVGKDILTNILCDNADQFTEDQRFTVLLSNQVQNIENQRNLLTSIYSNQSSLSYNSEHDEALANRIDEFYRKIENPDQILKDVLASLKHNPGARNLFLRTCLRSDIKGIRNWSYDQEETKQAVVPMTFADMKARYGEFGVFAEHCLSLKKVFEMWQKCPVNLSFERKILWSLLPDSEAIAKMGREQQKKIFDAAFKVWAENDDDRLLMSVLQGMLLPEVLTTQDFKDIVSCFARVISKRKNSADIFKELANQPNYQRYLSLLQIIALSCRDDTTANWAWKNLLNADQQIALWKKYPHNELSGPRNLWNRIVKSFDGPFKQRKRLLDLLKFIADSKDVNMGSNHEQDLLKLVGKLAGDTRITKRDSRKWSGMISLLHSLSLRIKIDIESLLLRFQSNLDFAYKPYFVTHCARYNNAVIRRWGKSTKEYKDYKTNLILSYSCYILTIILVAMLVYASHLFNWPPKVWGRHQTKESRTKKTEGQQSASDLQQFQEDTHTQDTENSND